MRAGQTAVPANTATKVCDLPAGGPYGLALRTSGTVYFGPDDTVSSSTGYVSPSTVLTLDVNSIGNSGEVWAYCGNATTVHWITGA